MQPKCHKERLPGTELAAQSRSRRCRLPIAGVKNLTVDVGPAGLWTEAGRPITNRQQDAILPTKNQPYNEKAYAHIPIAPASCLERDLRGHGGGLSARQRLLRRWRVSL
jgi:hypothetical protein